MREANVADPGDAHKAMLAFLDGDRRVLDRWLRLIELMKEVRISEYNISSACNLRCKGCWFFEYELDKRASDARDPDRIAAFLREERRRGINTALLIGGEPSLFPQKIALFVEHMDRVNVATNGLRKLPLDGFENVALLVALFGGRRLDDELRAIRPGGRRFTGLFDKSLENYRNDPRAFYLYAITEDGIDQIEETVKRIEDNGNRLNFSLYSKYDSEDPAEGRERKEIVGRGSTRKASPPGNGSEPPLLHRDHGYRPNALGRIRVPGLPDGKRGPPRPFRTARERKSCPARFQDVGVRSRNGQFLLHVRSLRRVSRQPSGLQLAVGQPAQVPAKREAARDVDRDRRELLEPVCVVPLRRGACAPGRGALRSRGNPETDGQPENFPASQGH